MRLFTAVGPSLMGIALAAGSLHGQAQAAVLDTSLTTGDWVGQMSVGDSALFVRIGFSADTAGGHGNADIPQENSWGVRLFELHVSGGGISFRFKFRADTVRFDGLLGGDLIDGTLERRGVHRGFRLMHRMAYDSVVVKRVAGNYRVGVDHIITLGPLDEADGWLSFFDTKTRRGGILRALSDTVFYAGPSFGVDYPVSIRAEVHLDRRGTVESLTWREQGQPVRHAMRLDDVSVQDVRFDNGSVRLAGMVTLPKTRGPHPAVILLHGCCGTIPTRDFGYWSNYFAGHGVAVLAYDRRGGGASTGNRMTATFDDVASDVVAGITYLESRHDIDPSRIGLYGMSNGGYIAPLAAAKAPGRVAFIAVRSGSALRVGDNISYEVGNDLRSEGFPESAVIRGVAIRQRVTDFIVSHPVLSTPAWDSLRAEVNAVSSERWFGWARVGWVLLVSPADSAGLAFINALRTDWQYDPIPAWRAVRSPVYIMLGALDRSVPTALSAPMFRAALREAGVVDATVRVFDNGNHGLLEARSGYQREVQALGRYVPGFQDGLLDWVRRHVGLTEAPY